MPKNRPYDIALRPDDPADPDLMDDIVVNNVVMFRAEQMDRDSWWVSCTLRDGEELVFDVRAKAKPTRIEWRVQDRPFGSHFIYEDGPNEEGQ